MIVQHRADALRLFAQHDHGLVSGAMAHHWTADGRLSAGCALAVAVHDYAWHAEDRRVTTLEDGTVADFLTMPLQDKHRIYREGIDQLETVHPYAALLVSHHYSGFMHDDDSEDFRANERARRERLGEVVGLHPEGEVAQRDLRVLRLLDMLALYLPIAAPGSIPGSVPSWLSDSPHLKRFGLSIGFDTDGTFRVTPSPFDRPFEVTLPYRELRRPKDGDPDWVAAWDHAATIRWRVRIR